MKRIYKCGSCKDYTMKQKCPKCGSSTVLAKPLKYSPEDKLAAYRRAYKSEKLENEGLI